MYDKLHHQKSKDVIIYLCYNPMDTMLITKVLEGDALEIQY